MGLFIPFSNLNLEAIIPKSELSHHQVKAQVVRFCECLGADPLLFADVSLIDRKSLLVVKVQMSAAFAFKRVEIAFRMYYLEDTTFSERLIRGYLAEHPPLRPLYFFLKHFFHKHQLDDQGFGGINTFSLLLTLAAFLQHRRLLPPAPLYAPARPAPPAPSAGQLLLEFLFFFGHSFDFQNNQLIPALPGAAPAPAVFEVP